MKIQQLSRGLRNNNPLNIRIGNAWLGEVKNPTDKEFEQFESLLYGLRAAFVLIRRYIRRYGLCTIRQIVTRWAPARENNTAAYVGFVARRTTIDPDTPIRWIEDDRVMSIVEAMAKYESGIDLTEEQLLAGYEAANL